MKCPKCDREMKVIKEDVSNNGKDDADFTKYRRVVYWCEQDDAWINYETP